MSEIGVDTSAAQAYASALVPGLFGPWARDAISWAGISQGDQVLDVRVRIEKKLAEFPSAEAFLEAVARGAPSSRFALAKVAPDDRSAFVSEVSRILGPYAVGGALRFPMESYVLQAHP